MEIALFPLPNLVLFPNIVVPLHIFEERYKSMINGCIDRDEAFGLVLFRAGAEAENEQSIHRVGVSARVVEVERLQEGRLNILCEGESRFRIHRFTQQVPFWKGAVDFFDDDQIRSTESLYDQVAELYRGVAALSAKLSGSEAAELALPESATDLSFMVSYVLDIESEEKQKLLEMTSTAERLRMLIAYLTETLQKLEQHQTRKDATEKVRGNGDLGKPHKGN
ncbi:MAG TPA: LON peptidase substrate-binding domain-containing protein [Terriglobia bacterium]|jgi:Lon protease-like protein